MNLAALALAPVAALLLGHRAMGIRAAAPQRPAVVATVDLERLFNGLNERAQADVELQGIADGLEAEGRSKRDTIDAMRAESEVFPKGSEKYNEAMEKLTLAVLRYEAFIEFGRRKIDVRRAAVFKRIYLSIKDASGIMAEQLGIDVVLVDDSIADFPADISEAETRRHISARRMLYTNDGIDITDELMDRMNAAFDVAGGG